MCGVPLSKEVYCRDTQGSKEDREPDLREKGVAS